MSSRTRTARPAHWQQPKRGGGQRVLVGSLIAVALAVVVAIAFFLWKVNQDEKRAKEAAELDPALQSKPVVTAGQGDVTQLTVTPIVRGKGPKVVAGQQLTVNYVGVTYKDGKEFDASWNNGQPVTFPIGTGNLIKGWDEGLIGVQVGSRVQLDIPADKAYGEETTGGQPAGDLRFVVDILSATGP